ncbi:LysM peptidoglycan-binding domain-containing protein [Calidifontibacillus erzurumensis]|uniref:LysM peptidoglycan-binding domain-containing protein n=1 Tax=Calidifontibacillus erzurumensis TaxID=2741433 RepID=A0A8J8GAV8_9BACI|nr:LysM peptidoglycan-binding domain-containing protein [Calidifontibacillus erzurumensis]NSL50312.1 LysM peptidoglycan-binding domain-containing protein [Calidifontibacillus erzurumensis]
MKKLLGLLLFLFVLYVIYYDLSEGVLSTPASVVLFKKDEMDEKISDEKESVNEEETATDANNGDYSYIEVEVKAGETVLSIVEKLQGGPLPVSISQLITDFQQLNPNTTPELIQVGKTYKFPVYNK